MPSCANRQLHPYQSGSRVARIVYIPGGMTKIGDWENDEMALVGVKLRLCLWLREGIKVLGRRRIPRKGNGDYYVDSAFCWEETRRDDVRGERIGSGREERDREMMTWNNG